MDAFGLDCEMMNIEKFNLKSKHSAHFLKMALDTERRQVPTDYDGYGKRTGVCGDTVEIFISVRDECIRSVAYMTDGCLNTNACANTVAFLAEGRTIDEGWEIKTEHVIDHLESLPAQETHCAELAVGALYLALANCQDIKRSSWKKLYQKKH